MQQVKDILGSNEVEAVTVALYLLLNLVMEYGKYACTLNRWRESKRACNRMAY